MPQPAGWVELEAAAILLGVDDEHAARADHQVVEVGPDLGHGVTLDAGTDGERVEPEDLREYPGAASSQTGMSTQTSPSSRASSAAGSSTGCCWMRSSDTKRTSIPSATS